MSAAGIEFCVEDDPAAKVAEWLRAVARKGGNVVLAGGSTPRRAYELAADHDWSRATVWFGDDRAVAPDDERSNYRMVEEALLSKLGRQPDVRRIKGELGAEAAADAYDAELTGVTLGLVLLGLGPDGHTASLFPGKPEVEVSGRRAVAVPEAGMEPYVPRVSLTLEAINSASHVVFLIAGEDKREMVRRVFYENDQSLPAARVHPHVVYLDRAAAP